MGGGALARSGRRGSEHSNKKPQAQHERNATTSMGLIVNTIGQFITVHVTKQQPNERAHISRPSHLVAGPLTLRQLQIFLGFHG